MKRRYRVRRIGRRFAVQLVAPRGQVFNVARFGTRRQAEVFQDALRRGVVVGVPAWCQL